MPRTRKDNRGGSREGKPGQAYASRSDLTQAPSAGPSQEYGQKTQRLASQQQAPLPASPQPQPGPTTPGAAGGGVDLAALLAGAPSLDAPSMRPGEPLTAGLSSGPGVGPEGLMTGAAPNTGRALIQAMVRENPSPELFALLADLG